MRRLGAVVMLALLASGCGPDLADGLYGCNPGSCPAGWTCRSDDRCYSPSAPGFALYHACLEEGECASGACARPFDTMAAWGQCSTACASSGDCGQVAGVAGVCADGACVAACDDATDCPPTMHCLVTPMTAGETACMEISDPSYAARSACDGPGPGACPPGLECFLRSEIDPVGVCTWPCIPGGECPLTDECLMVPSAVGTTVTYPARPACMTPCSPMVPGACVGLACASYPAAATTCVPSGWVGP